jgi:hypothetical protein
MKYVITTSIEGNKIIQEGRYEDELNSVRTKMVRKILNTEEQQVKDALIKLGWTPPKDKE